MPKVKGPRKVQSMVKKTNDREVYKTCSPSRDNILRVGATRTLRKKDNATLVDSLEKQLGDSRWVRNQMKAEDTLQTTTQGNESTLANAN